MVSVDPSIVVAQTAQTGEQQTALPRQSERPDRSPSRSRRIDHGGTADEYRATHEALRRDDQAWQSLAFAGLQHDGRGGLIELRHCPSCQSTIARPIAPSEALYVCELQADLAVRSKLALTEANDVSIRSQASREDPVRRLE